MGAGLHKLVEKEGAVKGAGLLLFPGCLAFLMTSSEFALLQRTSVVTLSICGIFKEVVTISAAGIVFHDPLTPINISGLLITIASIAAYNYIKIKKMRRVAQDEADKAGESGAGLLQGDEQRGAHEPPATDDDPVANRVLGENSMGAERKQTGENSKA